MEGAYCDWEVIKREKRNQIIELGILSLEIYLWKRRSLGYLKDGDGIIREITSKKGRRQIGKKENSKLGGHLGDCGNRSRPNMIGDRNKVLVDVYLPFRILQ